MTTDADAVRALIAAVRADRTLSRSDTVLNLAHATEALLAERDQAQRDWYAANRRGVLLEAEIERMQARLTWQQIAREHGTKE